MEKHKVTLIPGDGVGPEIVRVTQKVLIAAGAKIEWEECEAGASVFKKGIPSGVPKETIESVSRTRVVLKGPLETPVGFGEKSANVTLRKLFETYANVRPVRELPGVKTPYSGRGVDLVVVRENVEDLYAGIEHMQTPGVAQCLKLISRKGCEKVVKLAYAYARSEGRKKVHCATKANIMKFTEGFLKRTFEELAKSETEFDSQHIIVDNCAHQLVKKPEQFEVIVTTNMNGDILSDLTSALIGGLGFAPSMNVGTEVAIFEAVHGSAPKYAGKDCINPLAVLFSAVLMLRHLGQLEIASSIEAAVLVTLEQGKMKTRDFAEGQEPVSTTAFADAIIANLGKQPKNAPLRSYRPMVLPTFERRPDLVRTSNRRVVGVDLFLESAKSPEEIGTSLSRLLEGTALKLVIVSNRGTKVFPSAGAMVDTVDHFPCRLMLRDGAADLKDADLLPVLDKVSKEFRWMHIEKLLELDGKPGFSKAQGED